MQIKLAEALLRRKELQEKVDQLRSINVSNLFETRVKRINVSDSIDNVTAQVPKLSAAQVTAEYDYYARALRLIDAKIQQTNWTADIEVSDKCMDDYVAPAEK